jgi:hypothetical protein
MVIPSRTVATLLRNIIEKQIRGKFAFKSYIPLISAADYLIFRVVWPASADIASLVITISPSEMHSSPFQSPPRK